MINQLDSTINGLELGPSLAKPQAKTSPETGKIQSVPLDSSAESAETEESFSESLQKVERPEPRGGAQRTRKVDAKKVDSEKVSKETDLKAVVPGENLVRTTPEPVKVESDEIEPDLTSRQDVLSRFMSEMEEQIGIKPERLVQAMASLTPQELSRSPEETMNLVLNQLQIPLQDREQAEELYLNMLEDSEQAAFNEQESLDDTPALKKSPTVNEAVAFKQAPALKEQAPAKDQKPSLAQQSAPVKETPPLRPDQKQRLELNAKIDQLNQNFYSNQAKPDTVPAKEAQNFASAMEAPQQPVFTEEMAVLPQEPSQLFTADMEGLATRELMGADTTADFAAEGENTLLDLNSPQVAASTQTAETDTFFRQSESEAEFDRESQDEPDSKFEVQPRESISAQIERSAQPAAAAAPLTQVSKADQVQNIQDIMAKAQVLVQKGGGEMKVQLNPEGLGQLELKVQVRDGQVSVQMLAETQEAKRTLESSIGELKSHLTAAKLNLDVLKVDVARESGGSGLLGQDHNPQQAQDLAREFARGFLGNSREERQANRETLFGDMSKVRSYGSGVQSRIEDVPQATTSSGSKNRRLNVIA